MSDAEPDLVHDDEPWRPIGAQLVLYRDKVVDFPADALITVGREATVAYFGARLVLHRFERWRTDAAHRELLADQGTIAKRAGGKLPIANHEASIKRQEKRTRLSAWIALGVVVAVAAASIVHLEWGALQWLGALAGSALAYASWEYKRLTLLLASPGPVAAALLLGVTEWRWWPPAVAAAALLVVCEVVGKRWRPAPPTTTPGPAREGMSLPKMWETLRLRLLEDGITAHGQYVRIIVVDGVEVGARFGLTSREAILEKHVGNLARQAQVGPKWCRYVHPASEAVGEIVVFWRNPLEAVPPLPARRFGDVRYAGTFSLGRTEAGTVDLLCIAYTHVLVFGRTGSGKSRVILLIIDVVEDMPDAELYGIDTVGSSTLGAQGRRLGPRRVACGPELVPAAVRILDDLIVEADRRITALADQEDYDEDGIVDEQFLVDDRDGRRGIVLVIEEYLDFCSYPELVTRLLRLASKCRKAAMSIVVGSPSMAKDDLGEGRHFIKMAMVRVAMACTNSDVVQGLGAGALEAGWRPDQLQPKSEGHRNDAGTGYVFGGGRNRPQLTGFHDLDPEGAEARRRARRPHRDAWYRHIAPAAEAHDDPDIIDAEVVDEATLAREAALSKAIRLCGDRPGLPVREASDALTVEERAHVRGAAPSRPTYFPGTGTSDRAHRRLSLVRALTGASDSEAA